MISMAHRGDRAPNGIVGNQFQNWGAALAASRYPAAGTSWGPTGSLRGAVCCLRGSGRLRGEWAGEHGLPASAYFTPGIGM